jgi:hypothetical protein
LYGISPARLHILASLIDCSGRPRELPEGDLRSKFSSLDRIHRILSELPTREPFRKVLTNCINTNPAVISYIVLLMAVYLHLGPYSRYVIASIERRLTALDAEGMVPQVAAE